MQAETLYKYLLAVFRGHQKTAMERFTNPQYLLEQPDANAVRVMGPTAKQPTGSITVHGPTGQPINPATGNPDSRPNTHTPIKPTSTNP